MSPKITYKTTLYILLIALNLCRPHGAMGQVVSPEELKLMINRYKNDPRGPYLDIRWFCPDGTLRAAKDPCPDKPGVQRARYKDEVILLGKKQHLFLGQILASTPYSDFWDANNAQSRLIQYQLEHYLQNNDNGWINSRSQYYRGAVQTEDENNWGLGFYQWLLAETSNIRSHFFVIRQSAKYIPHLADNNNAQLIRSLSKEISDAFPAFQDLRIKLHGKPDEGDVQRVNDFKQVNGARIPADLVPKLDQLGKELTIMYRPFQIKDFDVYHKRLPKESEAAASVTEFIHRYATLNSSADRCQLISQTALQLRHQLMSPMESYARLMLIDLSNKLESMLINESSQWEPDNLKEMLSQVYCLAEAAAAFGFLELWEWDQLRPRMMIPKSGSITLRQMSEYSESGRQVSEWGAGMIRARYMPVINLYREFEPLANGFYDDQVRSSVLLPLGDIVSRLGDAFSKEAGFSNSVLNIPGQSSIHGLNPGLTVGELVVVTGSPEQIKLSPDKIYLFQYPPDNLKPVAGIATVSEGNLVSHVQLLARNLGIPNAVVSQENMNALQAYHGTQVFYAVSNKGTVIMKPVSAMDTKEREIFKQKKRSEEKISVPIKRIELDSPHILDLRTVDASHSGKICGPKAANLGQLKKMFPKNVVEGLVLPFAIFRKHMDQLIPGYQTSYWDMLNGIFEAAQSKRQKGMAEQEIEDFIIQRLDSLRNLIRKMPLLPGFREELQQQFLAVLGQPLGNIPVFVRSDTNMEDLKDFTGAGLNLTVFNVVDAEKIFQGIRDVWASPYTERSFRWRQRYLNNPENVFPSIVIIPSVNGDHSGVLITKGLASGNDDDITVAFSRGVGGAVDGQAAESWQLTADGRDQLITPAREPSYLAIPATGGSVKVKTTFEHRILSSDQLERLRVLSECVCQELPKALGINTEGPFDIELGFKDNKIWLFQVRPFVENKQAATSEYLQNITPKFDGSRPILLEMKL